MRLLATLAATMLLLSVVGCTQTTAQSPVEYGGVSGVLSTGNTSHYSLQFTNTGDQAVTALRGVVELVDDFGEVSGTIPVELTRQTRREKIEDDGSVSVVPFKIAAGETIHYIVIEWLDLSSQPVRFVRGETGFEAAVESELVLPLDPANATETRFRLDDVVFADR